MLRTHLDQYRAELVEGNRRCARSADCPRCGAAVVIGEDHDTCAMSVTINAEPIDRAGEMLATFEGRRTYNLNPASGKHAKPGTFHIFIRERYHVGSEKDYGAIHVEHACAH